MSSSLPRYSWILFGATFGVVFLNLAASDYRLIAGREFDLFEGMLVSGKLGLGVTSLLLSLSLLFWNIWITGASAVCGFASLVCIAYCAFDVKPQFGFALTLGVAFIALWGARAYQIEKSMAQEDPNTQR